MLAALVVAALPVVPAAQPVVILPFQGTPPAAASSVEAAFRQHVRALDGVTAEPRAQTELTLGFAQEQGLACTTAWSDCIKALPPVFSSSAIITGEVRTTAEVLEVTLRRFHGVSRLEEDRATLKMATGSLDQKALWEAAFRLALPDRWTGTLDVRCAISNGALLLDGEPLVSCPGRSLKAGVRVGQHKLQVRAPNGDAARDVVVAFESITSATVDAPTGTPAIRLATDGAAATATRAAPMGALLWAGAGAGGVGVLIGVTGVLAAASAAVALIAMPRRGWQFTLLPWEDATLAAARVWTSLALLPAGAVLLLAGAAMLTAGLGTSGASMALSAE